ncbi:MAG: efflux RND transporter periplasmic adaptor subunit [Phaeospirillum sp.]|nr:efflux RND transporter periplasmic adaptor subunit [Phaeospirillum sp.]
MTHPSKAVLAIILATLLGGGLVWRLPTDRSGDAAVLYGNIDVRQVDLGFRVEGRLTELLAEEGDRVAPGQKLAVLDKGYLEDAVRIAQARLDGANANLDKLEAGNRPQEIAQARADLARADAAAQNAREKFDRAAAMTLDRAVSRQSLDNARSELRQTAAQSTRAREALALAENGYRSEDVAIAKAQVEAEKATADLMRRRLADAELFSPADGVILTRVREPGSTLLPGATVLSLAMTSPMQVRTWVPESLLGRAAPGAKVLIATDSAPAKVYHGQIGFVSPVAEFTPKTVESPELRTSLVYRVRIIVSDPDSLLRQGMPVTVRIE